MTKLTRFLLAAGLSSAIFAPLSAQADFSRCTGKIRSMGYFVIDVDSDWGRPYDKFSAIKNGKEYDIWVNKSNCKVEQTVLDSDRRWYD